MLKILLAVYGILAVVRLVTQICLAQHHIRQHRSRKAELRGTPESPDSPEFRWPTITVIYPVYNESPAVLREVMERTRACLVVPEISFIFVDDGSPNREALRPVYEEFSGDRMQIVYQPNGGKRKAQCKGLETATGEIIVTVDSDTLIDLEGLRWLVAPLISDPRIGAVCGEVLVENSRRNLMTALQAPRYWAAFEMERAAQSVFRSVLCCSGPFSAYRRSILERVQRAYSSQTFFGQECTYGDDRHLTNLVLSCNYEVIYQPDATAWTYVPESIPEYARQQNRWNKSFYRELLWTLKIADRVHPYSLVDMLLNPLLFVLFTLTLSNYLLLQIVTADWRVAFGFLGMVILGGAVRAAYGLLRTGSPSFLLFSLYGLLHVFLLTPIRFKSLLTMTDTGWGTRVARSRSFFHDFGIWATGYLGLLLGLAGLIHLAGGLTFDPQGVETMRWTPLSNLWNSGVDVTALALSLTGLAGLVGGIVVVARELARGQTLLPTTLEFPAAAFTASATLAEPVINPEHATKSAAN